MEYDQNKKFIWKNTRHGRIRSNKIEEEEELLIFGYSCKLFRDDEKANYIDKEEHLIPWTGDTNLMIDRFDVRGALYDLSQAESKGEPFEESASEVELKEEELCEQERYFALYRDENLQQLYEEEAAKRLQVELQGDYSSYGQVGFDYNYYTDAATAAGTLAPPPPPPEPITYNPSADDDLFTPPPELNVPPGMEVPTSIKQNTIIVKTAKFVFLQGAQMEIVIKTKQAGNHMFNFLAFDHCLNPYYKHVVHMVRNGRYKWEEEKPEEKEEQYLHPNLSQGVRPDLTPGATSSVPKPDAAQCTYSKLITKIKEKQKISGFEETDNNTMSAPSSPLVNSGVTNSVKDPPLLPSEENTPIIPLMQSTPLVPKPPPTPFQQTPVSTGSLVGGYGDSNNTTPIVGLVDYPSFNQTADGLSDLDDPVENSPVVFSNRKKNSIASLSISSKSTVRDYSTMDWPPPETQMVIDKMASYIIKNGSGFQDVVLSRQDPRFGFLKKNHIYYPYYHCKIELYNEVYGDVFKNKVLKSPSSSLETLKKKFYSGKNKESNKKDNNSSSNRAISFSIKSREQEGSITQHTSFPVESSTSEEEEELSEKEKEEKRLAREARRMARMEKIEKEKREREEFLRKERIKKDREQEERRIKKLEADSSGTEDLYDIFKYAQEMENEKRGSSTPPEFNKQQTRKKKAAAFLSKLKKDDKKIQSKPVFGPELPSDFTFSGGSRSISSSGSSSPERRDGNGPPPLPTQPFPPPPSKSPTPPPLPQNNKKSSKSSSKTDKSPSLRSESPGLIDFLNNSGSIAAEMITDVTRLCLVAV